APHVAGVVTAAHAVDQEHGPVVRPPTGWYAVVQHQAVTVGQFDEALPARERHGRSSEPGAEDGLHVWVAEEGERAEVGGTELEVTRWRHPRSFPGEGGRSAARFRAGVPWRTACGCSRPRRASPRRPGAGRPHWPSP